jgi:hypothetical protein
VSIQGDVQEEIDREFYEPQLAQLRLARDSAVAMSEERLQECLKLRDQVQRQAERVSDLLTANERYHHLFWLAETLSASFERQPMQWAGLLQGDFIRAFSDTVRNLR